MSTMPQNILKAPFPYYGGKSSIAALVWERFGRTRNYVEPFFGSGAVLLGCPHPGHTETVNDKDGLLANVWRAIQADPEAVAHYADYPVSECDLHARHRSLVNQRSVVEQLIADPEWYDAKLAGWWVWGASAWIGGGWCSATCQDACIPYLGGRSNGQGVHRSSLYQLPVQVSNMGNLYWKIPHVGNAGMGVHRASHAHVLAEYFQALSARLRRVRVCCGDWTRVMGPSVTYRHGTTAIFLDPPYLMSDRAELYAVESDSVANDVREWAVENGDNPLLRIALCGYEGHYDMPDSWTAVKWKARGGYGSQGTGRGRENAHRETIWFSRHCLDFDALPLFAQEAR